MSHNPIRCAMCQEIERIALSDLAGELTDERYNELVHALFDRADRASAARRHYGQRKGYHR